MSEAKTARLYLGAAATAAITARATPEDRTALEAYGRPFAIAFQGRDPKRGSSPFFPVAMLHEDRGARAHARPFEPDDRLRVVAEHVASEGHVRARVEVRVDLRRDHHGDAALPRNPQELRDLTREAVPFVPPRLVPHREPVVHRNAVDHDETNRRIGVRELHRLLDQFLLLLETVRLREQDVLGDEVEVVPADLPESFEGHALRVDVNRLAARAHDIARELQAEVRLPAPGLPVKEGDAPLLDSPAQEVVQGPTAQGHLHSVGQSRGAL